MKSTAYPIHPIVEATFRPICQSPFVSMKFIAFCA